LRVLVGSKLKPWFALWVLVGVVGCASDEGADPSDDSEQGEQAEEVEEVEAPGSERTVSTDLMRLTVGETVGGFPHGSHGAIVCGQCHTTIAGHDTHQTIDCAACHQGAAFLGERVVFARGECLACHHGAEQAYSCEGCHDSGPAAVARTETIHLAVWPEPRTRVLPFDHAIHQTLACAQCHSEGVLLGFDRSCATCHQDHHQPAAECSTCHGEVPLETHDVDVHLGCGGAQCHQDALPAVAERSRSTCLVCHTAQADHQTDGDCATCHKVSGLDGLDGASGGGGEVRE